MKPIFYGRLGSNYRKEPGEPNHVTLTTENAQALGRKRGVITFSSCEPVRTLDDMTAAEKAALAEHYGCRVLGERYEWGLADTHSK